MTMGAAFFLEAPKEHFYELSTLIREYLPLASVVSREEAGRQGLFVPGIVLEPSEKGAAYYAADGSLVRIFRAEDPYERYAGENAKNWAKVSIAKVMGEDLPWGILTGVRPSKVAYAYLEEGLTEEEVASVLRNAYLLRGDKAELLVRVAAAERRLMRDQAGSDVSIYVGIPFCPTRCSYCSFISADARAYERHGGAYVTALVKEIESQETYLRTKKLRSFYMGGGTPTTLSAAELGKLLSVCARVFRFEEMKEITVEAGRPDTITEEKLRVLLEHGVRRISINPQTMVQRTLERIGRRHLAEQVEESVVLAREAGFPVINMDLIMGLPGEGEEEVSYTLEKIRAMRPENLTVHTLAVKRSSRLNEEGEGARMLTEDPGKLARQMDHLLALTSGAASQLGLLPYYMYRQKNMAGNFENVGYAQPGTECLYNIEMMEERQQIMAFGAGAVSKVYFEAENRLERAPNVKGPEEYIRRIDEMIERKRDSFGG